MPDAPVPPAPKGLRAGGRRLWKETMARYELGEHELLVLQEACRTADRLDRLAAEAATAPLTVTNAKGDVIANPLVVESRQQALVLSRLLAALRLPDDDAGVVRPQRR